MSLIDDETLLQMINDQARESAIRDVTSLVRTIVEFLLEDFENATPLEIGAEICDRLEKSIARADLIERHDIAIGAKVEKISGYKWPGVIVSRFVTLDGKPRLVVECTVPEVAGALHIYAPDQVKPINGLL